jgi:hypothetical protein
MENVFNAADSYRDFKRRLIEAGADDYSAQILAAVGLVREYLATREHDQRFAQYLKAASKLVGPLLAAGLSENDVATHLNFRLPFDLLTDGLGAPPAQELLLREGAGLPGEAVGAIRALLAARDRFVEVKPGVPRLLRPVGGRRALPWAFGGPAASRYLLGRLVEFDELYFLFGEVPCGELSRDDCRRLLPQLRELAPAFRTLGLRFRTPDCPLGLLAITSAAATERRSESPPMPEVRNSDGDPFEEVVTVFSVSDMETLAVKLPRLRWSAEFDVRIDRKGRVKKIEGSVEQRANRRRSALEKVTIAHLVAENGGLTVSTSSVRRDDKIRRHLERLPPGLLSLRETSRKSLHELMVQPRGPAAERRAEAEHRRLMKNPEVRARLREMMRAHSLSWCDTAIPALGNRRPRTLVRSEAGRARVQALLADFERRQGSAPEATMDLDLIRRELGF